MKFQYLKKKKKIFSRSAYDSSAHKVWEYLSENQLTRFMRYVFIGSLAKKVITFYACFSSVPISFCHFYNIGSKESLRHPSEFIWQHESCTGLLQEFQEFRLHKALWKNSIKKAFK